MESASSSSPDGDTLKRDGQGLSGIRLLTVWLLSWIGHVRRTGWPGFSLFVAGAAAGAGVALAVPSQFTSTTEFIAQGSSQSLVPSALLGLAASVGFSGSRDFSPQFYADLLTSRPVLSGAINVPLPDPKNPGERRSLLDIEGFTEPDSARRVDAGVRYLQTHVTAQSDVRTNIITLTVTAHSPMLAHDLAQSLLDGLNQLNVNFRQAQSHQLREFYESRVDTARADLQQAEDSLQYFLLRNRSTEGSPTLQLRQLSLTRAADLRRTVYVNTLQQYEEARAQEAKTIPVLTVLSQPSVPVRRSFPPRRLFVAIGGLVGLALAVLIQNWSGIRSAMSTLRA